MAVDELRIEKETLTGKGIPVLILYGAINVSTFEKLEAAIQELFAAKIFTVFIDVANVKYVSSAGAGVLMNAYLQAQEQKGNLVLIRLSPGVRDVLDLLNLHNVIPIAEDARAALELLK